VIVNLKTVPILLLLGCAGTDCGYPNVRFSASRHFGATTRGYVLEAGRVTWMERRRSFMPTQP